MNKLVVFLIFSFAILSCRSQILKKKVYITFENKKFGMMKFFDYGCKDSVYYFPLSESKLLYGIQFTPEKKSDIVLNSKLIRKTIEIQNNLWVKQNMKVSDEMYWKSPKTYIIEKINNDSVRITKCNYSTLIE